MTLRPLFIRLQLFIKAESAFCLLIAFLFLFGSCRGKETAPGDPPLKKSTRPEFRDENPCRQELEDITELEDKRELHIEKYRPYLNHQSQTVRLRAIRALGRVSDSSFIAPLLKAVDEKSGPIASEAIFALSLIPNERIEGELIARFILHGTVGKKSELSRAIIKALGPVATSKALPLLMKLLEKASPEIQGEAALTLGKILHRNPRIKGLDIGRLKTRLEKLFRSNSEAIRFSVSYLAQQVNDPQLIPLLIIGSNDNSARVRLNCLKGLVQLNSPQMKLFQKQFSQADRWHQVTALAGLLPATIKVLPLKRPEISGQLNSPAFENFVKKKILTEKAAAAIPLTFMKQLSDCPLRNKNHYLQLILDRYQTRSSDGGEIAAYSAYHLDLGLRRICHLEKITAPKWLRETLIISALSKIKPSAPAALGRLKAYLKSDIPIVRTTAAENLNILPKAEAVRIFKSLLSNSDPALIVISIVQLSKLLKNKCLPYLKELISTLARQDADVAITVIDILALFRKSKGQKAILLALAHPDLRVRKKACENLLALKAKTVCQKETDPRYVRPPYFSLPAANKTLHATIQTNKGDIVLRLLTQASPLTVQNFVRLAKRGFYKNLRFFGVIPGLLVQTGCPRGDGWGRPDYTIRCEINDYPFIRGAVGMAKEEKDAAGSQFFITQTDLPHLDRNYTQFGIVVKGMEVVDSISAGDRIQTIRIHASYP